jgi:outer membrane protein assembly factor BamB
LQGMGFGLAGGALAAGLGKPANATPVVLDSTTNPVFDALLPQGTTLIGEASLINGNLFVRTSTPTASGALLDIKCFDIQSNQFEFSLSQLLLTGQIPPTPFTDPVSDGLNVYAGNQQVIYAMDINGNALQEISVAGGTTGNIVSNLVLTNHDQNVIFFTDGGALSCFNISAQAPVWPAVHAGTGLAGQGITPVLITSGSTVYVYGIQDSQTGGLLAVNLNTGTPLYTSSPVLNVPAGTGASFSSGNIFITGTGGVLTAHDAATGNQLWSYPSSGNLNGPLLPPVCNNGQVLFADADGILHSVSQTTGAASWQASLPAKPASNSRIYVEDNIAYLALGPSSSLTAFGISLDRQQPLSYATQSAGVFVGVQNGVCYFSHNSGRNIAGRSFTPDLHGLFSKSELMEDYVASSGAPTTRTPTYRTHLLFLDSNYNPRPMKSVRIWASDTVQIVTDQNTYTVDQNNGVWLTTDAAGELPIVISPTDISCPAIYVWNSYMLPGDAMLIYPDWETTNSLSNLQASGMPANNPWDQTPLFAGVNGTDALASSIRNTIAGGSQNTAVAARLAAHAQAITRDRRRGHRIPPRLTGAASYIAYPAATPNMAFAASYATVDPTRPYSPGASPINWQLTIDSAGNCAFQPLPSGTVAVTFGVHISFHDLLDKVVHGIERITQIVANVAETISHTITTIAKDVVSVYTLVIDSVEAAAAVVSSALKSALSTVLTDIIDPIISAVKWLSTLFDWPSFLTTQRNITALVTSRLNNFVSWAGSESATELQQIHAFFSGLEGTITKLIDTAISTIGGSTLQSNQVQNNNPQAAYGANGANSYSQTKWLSSKVQGNVGQTTTVQTGVGDAANDILKAFESLLSDIGAQLKTSDFAHIPDDLKQLFDGFSKLWTNPSEFVENTLTSILSLLRDLVVGFIQFVDAVIESILAQIPVILTAALSFLTAEIRMPVIDDIWSAIAGGQLTILNLIALGLAIPATIVGKIVGTAGSQDIGDTGSVILASVVGFAGLWYGVMDSFSDLTNQSNSGPMAIANLALSVIGFFLAVPFDSKPTDIFGYTFYLSASLSLVISALAIGVDKAASPLVADAFSSVTLPSLNSFYGCTMVPFSVGMGLSYKGFGGLIMISNIFTFLPYVGKQLATGPKFTLETPQRAVPAAVDLVGDWTSAIINVVEAVS